MGKGLPWNTEALTIRLHDVLRSYLIQRTGKDLPSLHQCLLDAHLQYYHLTRWADLPQSETYLWLRLISHLCQADNQEALYTTLADLWYVTHHVLYQGISTLEADLLVASPFFHNEGTGHASSLFGPLHRTVMSIHHLLQQVSTKAEIGGLLLSYLPEKEGLAMPRLALERELPRPFLTAWHPLPAASSALLRIFQGHTKSVNGCGFSPDGKWIVSASRDLTLRVWDAATGAECLTLTDHTDSVTACAFSPDGKRVVSASLDQTLKVWDCTAGVELLTLKGHTGPVTSCAFSPDGTKIVSASSDNTLKVWDVTTGVERFTLKGHTSPVHACAISPDGRWIVSASFDLTLKVWETVTGEERLTLKGHIDWVHGCRFSPDGKWIVSASSDHTLKMWDAVSGIERFTLSGHTDAVEGCAVSGDGRTIVSASSDRTLKVWDGQTGQCLLTFPVDGHLSDCAFHPDGEHLVACGDVGVYFLRLVQ